MLGRSLLVLRVVAARNAVDRFNVATRNFTRCSALMVKKKLYQDLPRPDNTRFASKPTGNSPTRNVVAESFEELTEEENVFLENCAVTIVTVFRDECSEDVEFSSERWKTFSKKLIGLPDLKGKIIRPYSLSFNIIQVCGYLHRIKCAKSWVNYSGMLENSNPMSKLYLLNMLIKIEDFKDEEEFAKKIAWSVIDPLHDETLPHLYWKGLQVLTKTSDWLKVVDILKAYDFNYAAQSKDFLNFNISLPVSCQLGRRALKEDNIDLLFELMSLPCFHEYQVPLRYVKHPSFEAKEGLYSDILEAILKFPDLSKRLAVLERLLQYFHKYDVHVTKQFPVKVVSLLADLRKEHIDQVDLHCRLTKIDYVTGTCMCCGNKLPRTEITDKETQTLMKAIRDLVIIGDDIYQSTDPKELRLFEKFLEKGKYDLVIDGLNVSYQRVPGLADRFKPTGISSANLMETVKLFFKQKKKVLVIHRPELKGFPHYPEIDSMATVYMFDSVSQDDPFLILASLKSKCLFLSNDLMRQHNHLLAEKDPYLGQLFTKWQVKQQVFLTGFEKVKHNYTGPPKLIFPPAHDVTPTKTGSYWHIPIRKGDARQLTLVQDKTLYFGHSQAWDCIGPKVTEASARDMIFDQIEWPLWLQDKDAPTPTLKQARSIKSNDLKRSWNKTKREEGVKISDELDEYFTKFRQERRLEHNRSYVRDEPGEKKSKRRKRREPPNVISRSEWGVDTHR